MPKKIPVADNPAVRAGQPTDLKPEETERFHDLFAELAKTRDSEERKRIKAELAKLTFDS